MSSRLLDTLRSGRVLLMDGGMGMELHRAGLPLGACPEAWNRDHPDRVLAVHRAYLAASADCLLTNTFQANPAALARHGLAADLDSLILAGVELARAAGNAVVLGSVGPFDDTAAAREVAAAMNDCDGVLFETWSGPRVCQAIRHAACPQPVLLSVCYHRQSDGELRTFSGHTPEEAARWAAAAGAVALGVNCGRDVGMEDVAEILRRYREVSGLPLFARPNAGTPVSINGEWVYALSPESMAAGLPELLTAGAVLVGGCCGTTPAHIAACRRVLDRWDGSAE